MTNGPLSLIVALVLLVLLAALTDPFMVLMPAPLVTACLVAAAAFAALFSGLVLHEGARDEREEAHRAISGRAGYLAGIALTTLGILYQGFVDTHVDMWLAATLAVMVVVKLAIRAISDARN